MNKNNKKFKKQSMLRFLPIILMIAVVPFILRVMQNQLTPPMSTMWTSPIEMDTYTYGKTIMIMILSSAMLLMMYLNLNKKNIKLDKNSKVIYAICGFVTVIFILSTIFSKYRELALWGAPERHEGLIIQLCYIIMFVYTYILLKNVEEFKYIKTSMVFLAVGMAIVGISQAIGKNIITTDFVRRLITPSEYFAVSEKVDTGDMVYLTLMNPNYVGSYASMAILFFSSLAISKDESIKMRIASFILAVVTIFVLVKSKSQAGMVGVAVGFGVLLLLNIKKIFKNKKFLSAILLSVIVVPIAINVMSDGDFAKDIKKTVMDAAQLFKRDTDYVHDPSYGFAIKDISISGDTAIILTDSGRINLNFLEDGGISFRDAEGEDILSSYNETEDKYILKSPFADYSFAKSQDSSDDLIQTGIIYENKMYFIFQWTKDEGINMIDHKSNVYEWEAAPYIGFEGKEKIGSGRGYIWSRTLPLILEKPILGYGPDTFIPEFPQYDMLAKKYAYDNIYMKTDKPHNLFLMYAFNSGIFALVALLALWGIYIADSFKILFRKSDGTKYHYYAMACFTAVVAYLATGMFNDSVPVIAPVFWVIFGAGCAMNYLIKKENAVTEE